MKPSYDPVPWPGDFEDADDYSLAYDEWIVRERNRSWLSSQYGPFIPAGISAITVLLILYWFFL